MPKSEKELEEWHKNHMKKYRKIFKKQGCLHWRKDADKNKKG
jgi:hypothetical protein|tara:strand:+ start:984 stop:1109 length:126 start_codon:yes stop_codon:yes gene_type:complete